MYGQMDAGASGTRTWWTVADGSSEDRDARYAGRELVWSAEPNPFVVAETADLPPGAAADVACGEGRNAVWLAGRGWSVTGVDFSAVALDEARTLAAAAGVDVEWVHADALAWAPPREYDLVLVASLQLPPPERAAALRTAAGAVAPGGSLLVVAHDARNRRGVGGPGDERVLHRPDEVVAPGFAEARREAARRPVGDRDALDTVVRLVRPA